MHITPRSLQVPVPALVLGCPLPRGASRDWIGCALSLGLSLHTVAASVDWFFCSPVLRILGLHRASLGCQIGDMDCAPG